MKILSKTFLCLILLSPAFSLPAQDTASVRSWSLTGYLKEMPQVLFYNINERWYFNNLVHNRLNFKWNISPSFTTAVEMRNRLSFGNFSDVYSDYASSFTFDNGVVPLSWNIVATKTVVLNTTIDRLWIDYTKKKFQATVGRQRVNWGINTVWNPNDIFNTYSYLDFDYEERPGSDAVRLQYYPGAASRAEVTIKADRDWKITGAGLYRFNLWGYDFQFLGGCFQGSNLVIGAGWTGEIAKGGFTGEASYFHPVKDFADTTGVFVGSVGYNYTFKNSLQLMGEVLYNGNPNGNLMTLLSVSNASANAMSAMNPFISGVSIFGGISYPFVPLLTGSLSAIWNPENKIYIVIPSLTLSLAGNLDLMLLSQVVEVYESKAAYESAAFVFLRLKWNF
jgi:hypothetical protein